MLNLFEIIYEILYFLEIWVGFEINRIYCFCFEINRIYCFLEIKYIY